MRTVKVWRTHDLSGGVEILCDELTAESVALTENNTLVVYKMGEPYRMYHPSVWKMVDSEENRVTTLD